MNSESAAAETTSLPSKLFHVFAAPGEVFDELRGRPPVLLHWLVPALISCLTGVLFSVVVFSQPDIVAGLRQQQEAQLQGMVEAGKLTPEQRDQQLAATARFMSKELMMGFGIGGAVVGTFVFLAFVSVLIWLLADKIFKGGVPLMKAFELVGLASVIYVLAGLVTLGLVLWKGSLTAAPNAALLLTAFDPKNVAHQLLGALNGFTLWFLAVLALGVARLTGQAWGRAAAWIFGVWLAGRVGVAFVSAALARLQG